MRGSELVRCCWSESHSLWISIAFLSLLTNLPLWTLLTFCLTVYISICISSFTQACLLMQMHVIVIAGRIFAVNLCMVFVRSWWSACMQHTYALNSVQSVLWDIT